MEETFVFIVFFGTFFGIVYLFFSTRHKERMALIEKGESADLFVANKRKSAIPLYAVILINLGIIGIGVGIGIILGQVLNYIGMDDDISFPASIFICLGVALLTGFKITRRVDEHYRDLD